MAERMVADPSARRIVNTFEGTTNVFTIDEQRKTILDALDMCIRSLERHFGPTSGYSMHVDANGVSTTMSPHVFTRDGIKTLSLIEYLSPIQTYFKNLICYIGDRVDSIAKDGTTTAMLFSAYFLQHILKGDNKVLGVGKLPTTRYHIKEMTDWYLDQIQINID